MTSVSRLWVRRGRGGALLLSTRTESSPPETSAQTQNVFQYHPPPPLQLQLQIPRYALQRKAMTVFSLSIQFAKQTKARACSPSCTRARNTPTAPCTSLLVGILGAQPLSGLMGTCSSGLTVTWTCA